MNDAIAAYSSKLDPSRAAICRALQSAIDSGLPQATSKLWHATPVWFIGSNPVVGYAVRKEGVTLLFWNGQRFDEPDLEHSGSFHAGQIRYDDAAQIDPVKLARWLGKAATNIWDITGQRESIIAERKAAKKKAAKKKAAKKAAKKPAKKKVAPRRKR